MTGTQVGAIFQASLLPASYLATTNKIFTSIRLLLYFSTNFWVNLVDFVFKLCMREGMFSGYYHDEFTATSFSYTVHQMALCNLFAFCTSELISPNHVKRNPELLSFAVRWSVPLSVSMLVCFLIELTWFAPELRLAVF